MGIYKGTKAVLTMVLVLLFFNVCLSDNEENYKDNQNEEAVVINTKQEKVVSTDKNIQEKAKIFINGKSLTKEQIAEIEKTYNVKPKPGNYWYDKTSGLYGVVGYPAFGFMLAGHNYGTMKRNVSNGNTGIIINGRELPQLEWAVWSQMLGYWIQPSSYWLDQYGNAGYEGYPTPIVNLYLAAQQNAYSGRGSGDNFWSSRFGAGNYDSGNQRGYVSVPGHGPIGYGF